MAGASPPGPTDPTRKPTVTKDGTNPVSPGQGAGPTGATAGGATPAAATAAAAGPAIKIDPPKDAAKASDGNPIFSITADPKMPVITLTASITGVTTGADPTPTTEFQWTAKVSFDSGKCPNGVAKKWRNYSAGDTRKIAAITASGKVKGGNIVVTFDKIRGGDLVITVTAKVGTQDLTGTTKGWRIQGTNPTKTAVANALADDTHCKIACQESQMTQFFPAKEDGNALYPYFSGDQFLGIGICQLTDPAASDDAVWDWTQDVKEGITLYKQKKTGAKNYPGLVAKTPKFLNLVQKYNESLQKAAATPPPAPAAAPGKPPGTPPTPPGPPTPAAGPGSAPAGPTPPAAPPKPVTVKVPEFTADQLEDDTIRGFNGWGGDDGFLVSPKQLHEFRIQVDKAGALVVEGDPKSGTVSAKWERVLVADRPSSGDPSYIDNVKNRDPKTCAKKK